MMSVYIHLIVRVVYTPPLILWVVYTTCNGWCQQLCYILSAYTSLYYQVVTLADLIVQSQSLMRLYASEQLRKLKMKPEDVEVCVFVCLSLSVCMYMYITITDYSSTLCMDGPRKKWPPIHFNSKWWVEITANTNRSWHT